MKKGEFFYVVTDSEIYAQCVSEEEAMEHIAELERKDNEARKMWMDKMGYVPSDVDIPDGYYITQNPYI